MFILLVPCVFYACANTTSLPRTHPEDVRKMGLSRPNCSECHTDSWSALNHRAPNFFAKHRFYATAERQACRSCHHESFCADCHAHNDEIKPNDKYTDSPERNLPHRGDYLSQHRIDGKVNPTTCVRCHGRQNNERCKTCHR
jgi:hypothetical protein